MQKKSASFSIISTLLKKKLLSFLIIALCVGHSENIITNARGEAQSQAHLSDKPQRIVVFPLFAEEMLLEMIGSDRIVYVGHEYFENGEAFSPTMELTKDILGRDLDIVDEELILDLNPDLVILQDGSLFDHTKYFPELYQANIPFLFLSKPKTIEDIRGLLLDLGEIVGAPKKAAQMVEEMEAGLAQITEIVSDIPEEKRARVFHYVYFTNDYRSEEEKPYTTWYRQNSFVITARAADVIAEGPDTEAWIIGGPEERLIEANPDIITFDYEEYYTWGSVYDTTGLYHDEFINDLLNNPKLSNVPAIKNKAIYPIRLCESQFVVLSAKELAQFAYPDLFSGEDK